MRVCRLPGRKLLVQGGTLWSSLQKEGVLLLLRVSAGSPLPTALPTSNPRNPQSTEALHSLQHSSTCHTGVLLMDGMSPGLSKQFWKMKLKGCMSRIQTVMLQWQTSIITWQYICGAKMVKLRNLLNALNSLGVTSGCGQGFSPGAPNTNLSPGKGSQPLLQSYRTMDVFPHCMPPEVAYSWVAYRSNFLLNHSHRADLECSQGHASTAGHLPPDLPCWCQKIGARLQMQRRWTIKFVFCMLSYFRLFQSSKETNQQTVPLFWFLCVFYLPPPSPTSIYLSYNTQQECSTIFWGTWDLFQTYSTATLERRRESQEASISG